jgi:hypothetical protein
MAIGNKILDLLKKVDLYGLSFPLRYEAHHEYNTVCGVTLSLTTIFGMTVIVLIFIVNNFKRKSVSVIQNSEQLYEKRILNFSRVPLLIGFVNDGGRPVAIDPRYIRISFDKNDHYPEINKEGIMFLRRESTPISLEYCDLNKHFNNESYVIEMIKDFEYQNYLCVVPGQNLSIAGRFGDSIHGYDMLEIHLIKCENSTEKQDCATYEEIEKFYTNSYMSILYLSEALEHYDTNNPIRKSFRSEVFMIVSNTVKRYYYYFAPGEYISDDGYIFSFKKFYEFFEYQNTAIDFVDKEDQSYYSGQTLIEVSFSSVDKFITYERSYPKIQDSLGNIGGWIRIILTVCQFLSNYFSEKIFILDIINKITVFKDKKKVNNLSIRNNSKNKVNNSEKSDKQNQNYKKYKDIVKNNNYISNDSTSRNNIQISRNSNNLFNTKDFGGKTAQNIEQLNQNQTTNSELKYTFTINQKEKIRISCIEYILPFWVLEKNKKHAYIILFKKCLYKDISLEVLIPLVERLSKMYFGESVQSNYLSKINHSSITQAMRKT